jgi:hypothetical protein
MAIRAHVKLGSALRVSLNAGEALDMMEPVKFGSDDDTIVGCDGSDPLMIGWSEYAVSYTDGKIEANVILDGTAIIPVVVATSLTATRGKLAIGGTGATYSDAPTLGGGTTLRAVKGRFLQSGIAGDKVALLIGVTPPMVSA